MKIRTIPAIIALIMLLGNPFGFGRLIDSDPSAGLLCYCCSTAEGNCPMLSCSGCCGGAHAVAPADRWSPEMTLESLPFIIPAAFVYGGCETEPSPETVYLDLPDKPPKHT